MDVRMVDDFMAIKPSFFASMGYQYFLSYGAPCVCTFGPRRAPLIFFMVSWQMCLS